MNLRPSTSVLALLLGGALAAPALAQSTEAMPGTISNVTLNLTVTETIGAFLIKDADVEKNISKNPSISYDADFIRNPLGFNSEVAKANHYAVKQTVRYRAFDSEMEEFVDPTFQDNTFSTKLHTTRYGNAQFLADLVIAGRLPTVSSTATMAQNIAGWSLVSVRVASDAESESDDDTSYIFAIKNGQTPVLVGKIGDWSESDAENENLALLVYPGTYAEAYTETETVSTRYTRSSDGEGGFFFEANEPVENYAERYSGTSTVSVLVNRSSTVGMYLSGLGKYSGSYNARSGATLSGPISATLNGSFDEEDEASSFGGQSGPVTGTLTLSAENLRPDVSTYAALMPDAVSISSTGFSGGFGSGVLVVNNGSDFSSGVSLSSGSLNGISFGSIRDGILVVPDTSVVVAPSF